MPKLHRALFVLCLLVSLSAFAQSADQQLLSATDSPDPVLPGNNITYTIQIRNNGPDPATNGGLNGNIGGGLTFVSASSSTPGFSCINLGNNLTCSNPSFASGVTATFTVVAQVGAHLANFPDTTVSSYFYTSGVTPDPNNGNNDSTVVTSVNSPQMDLSLTVTDSPDPVFPDGNITYTVPVTNAGPDSATSVNFNVVNSGNLQFQSISAPAGWNCTLPAVGGLPLFTCTTPTFAPGTVNFTVVLKAEQDLIGINDTTVTTSFSVNGTGDDTNDNNNTEAENTAYVTPDADMSVSVTDSPDPVFQDGNITYTVQVSNSGPNAATSATMSVYNASGLGFVSVTEPAGWSCAEPAAGAFVQFSCTNPSLASGATSIFTVVVTTDTIYYGNTEGTITTSFSAGSGVSDPNNANNTDIETTAYVTPDADMAVTVTDSPDPVFPDGTITYTVQVTNNGPDTATNATMSAHNTSGLGFVSVTEPAGWSCTEPAPGAFVQFSCTNPSFASGATSTFTLVATTDTVYYGNAEGTISTAFSVGSNQADPNNPNNVEIESTAYVTPDADMSVAVTDSPDPVFPDGNITYTINVANTGPDAAPNAALNIFNNGSLQYESVSAPAGWNCTPPAVGSAPTFSCTLASFPSGSNVVFTLVVKAEQDNLGINDGTVSTSFSVGSAVADPDNTDNVETENTAYVTPDADMTVAVTDSPDPVFPDGNITYTINVGNSGPDAAPNATLTIFNSSTLQFQSISAPAGWSCTAPAVNGIVNFSCTNPSFASGSNVVFTLVAQADATINGINDSTIATTFAVSSNVSDPNNANNQETENTAYVTPDADLAVTNADSPDPVSPGGTITYTQSVRNDGPDAAPNASFTQTLPASVGFQSISAPAGWNCATPAVGASGAITCTNPSLASGVTANFTVVVTVLANSGTVSNTVTASSTAQDPDPLDNSATVTTTILAPTVADLGITKTTQSDNAAPGANVLYTITLTNSGPDAAANVVVTDTLPASLLFQSISEPAGFDCTTPAVGASGTITCTAASMAASTTATFTLIVEVAGNATGTINNTATATSDTDDNNGGNDSGGAGPVIVGAGSSDLGVTKSTNTTTASPGDPVAYTITVTNNGPDAASEVIVTDTLPPSLLFQSITPAATFTCTTPAAGTTGTITCTGGPLANGATAVFTLNTTISPSATGSISNSASVSSSNSDSNDTNSTATSPVLPVGEADLSITKTTNVTQAQTGNTINYTITVTNNGPEAATNVIVTDDLPTGLQFVSATPSQGSCTGTDPFNCNLGTLASGASATVTLQALVTATSGTITNTATVDSDVDDDNLGNNTSSTPPTPVNPGASEVTGIPTLSEWALMALIAMLAMAAVLKMRM
jgi:uncharacterized repeat protein (TIGR01451 family)